MMKHDSRDPAYRSPMGAAAAGSLVQLAFDAPGAREVILRCWYNNAEFRYPMTEVADGRFSCTVTLPEKPGLFWYFFLADGRYYGNAPDRLGGEGAEYGSEPPSFQITVYDPAFRAVSWAENGVMMQIFPDRYARGGELCDKTFPKGAVIHPDWNESPNLAISDTDGDNLANDFFGGDLEGIRRNLGYIRSLGVNVLYLNPIFLSSSNHRYNTSDYLRVDPALGSREDLVRLCADAGKAGIRVILDGVFSHTGADSVYFNKYGTFPETGAYQSRESRYFGWYRFERYPDKYDSWWGFDSLPNVDEMNPDYRGFICDEVIPAWLSCGTSGWRLDVADELPMAFIRAVRSAEKAKDPDALLLGEVWEDPTNKIAYDEQRCYAEGDTLDGTMNYPLRDAVIGFLTGRIDAFRFAREVMHLYETQPAPFYTMNMNLLGSHDKARIISVLSEAGDMEPDRAERREIRLTPEQYALGTKRFLAAWRLLCWLPGMPCLYYGDEAGMTGMSDPYNRGTFPWGMEDRALTEAFRSITGERKRSPILRTGAVRVEAADGDTVAVIRTGKKTEKRLTLNRKQL